MPINMVPSFPENPEVDRPIKTFNTKQLKMTTK
jgi:hypothetical protein